MGLVKSKYDTNKAVEKVIIANPSGKLYQELYLNQDKLVTAKIEHEDNTIISCKRDEYNRIINEKIENSSGTVINEYKFYHDTFHEKERIIINSRFSDIIKSIKEECIMETVTFKYPIRLNNYILFNDSDDYILASSTSYMYTADKRMKYISTNYYIDGIEFDDDITKNGMVKYDKYGREIEFVGDKTHYITEYGQDEHGKYKKIIFDDNYVKYEYFKVSKNKEFEYPIGLIIKENNIIVYSEFIKYEGDNDNVISFIKNNIPYKIERYKL